MSAIWYECKVKYKKFDEATASHKMKTEPFLVDAISYTEAESRITEEMAAYLSDSEEIKITNIKIANYAEIHPFENSDRWFKSKISLIAVDEESGKKRKTNIYFLVQANDVKEAYENTVSAMADTMGEYSIPSIAESPIMDVFPYFTGEEEDVERLKNFTALRDSKRVSNETDEVLEMEDSLAAVD
ncbi:protein of unknown function [Nonlabens sp. Hel1_33_55]|uniref:DUF4494 domain-containing protein n=1 Tax=Nonlabens sp. Hel1_33_55 TaxID=1336802 RepID=UPI000875E064|nr:DUF4494 domain-containing protein [Nonlabens sp. Hel1_33_55]SCY04431.1 protein of unknown function [Nonlabens sp. Hel1_33_55]